MEQNLRRALSITDGEVSILWASPISIALWICAAVTIIVPVVYRRLAKRAAQQALVSAQAL
jgi:putative tricarboxylic transport membrane protein